MGTRRTRTVVAVLAVVLAGVGCRADEVATPPASRGPASVPSTTRAAPAPTVATTVAAVTTIATTVSVPSSPVTTPVATVATATTSPAVSTAPPTTGVPAVSAPATVAATTTSPATDASRSVVLDRLPDDRRVIALTFDAGSDLGHTELILDTLAEMDVPAAFGITGEFAESHPDHVQRIAREGHVIINHSYSHVSFTGASSTEVALTAEDRHDELTRADTVISSLVGRITVPFWRPPFGDHDTGVLDDVGAIGYRYTVMWTLDSLGWRGLSAAEIVQRVVDLAEPGAIVLMHVGSQSADGEALPAVIDGLRVAGYTFVAIDTVAER